MSKKILITDGMNAEAVEILKAQKDFSVDLRKSTSADELAGIIGNYDAIVIRSATTLTKDLIEKANSMKLIVRAGAGVDNIDVPTATARKIPVMNTASANANAAAEQTIALLFAMFRQIPQAYVSLRAAKWERDNFKGYEVAEKTLGVIGLGNIGRMVCEKAIGLGMRVIGYDPVIKSVTQLPTLARLSESFTLVNDPDEAVSKCDVLTLHVPKAPATANFVNADRLSKMKNGSFLINCARGGVVDEKAVIDALETGKLAGAAFDVFEKEPPSFESPLLKHPKVVCVPHLGASTHEAQARVGATAAKQMIGFFARGERAGVIN